jgi:hypothetical protein
VTGEGLDNAGTLMIAARSSVTATSYRQTPTGILEVGLEPSLTSVSGGSLVVSLGPITLAGTLHVDADATIPADVPWQARFIVAPVIREGTFDPVEGLDDLPAASVIYAAEGVAIRNEP